MTGKERVTGNHSQSSPAAISFLTPYWDGREMMRIHLASLRQFYPDAPILISKRGGNQEEMEAHRSEFAVQYWLKDCPYIDALLRLLERCETEYVCILDHDTVLLSTLDPYLQALREGRYDLVGVEERIREPPGIDWQKLGRASHGWWRFAPGHVACNFIVFNWKEFSVRWGLRGVRWQRTPGTWDEEYDYGIGQKFNRHKYLLPFHVRKYGVGNLLQETDIPVLWHQWYGSHRTRFTGSSNDAAQFGARETLAIVEQGERAFLADYPHLDLSDLTPAWGPEYNIEAEKMAAARRDRAGVRASLQRALVTASAWRHYGWQESRRRGLAKLKRWWRGL